MTRETFSPLLRVVAFDRPQLPPDRFEADQGTRLRTASTNSAKA